MSWFKSCLSGSALLAIAGLLATPGSVQAHANHTTATPATASPLHYLHPDHSALPLMFVMLACVCLYGLARRRQSKLALARVRRSG